MVPFFLRSPECSCCLILICCCYCCCCCQPILGQGCSQYAFWTGASTGQPAAVSKGYNWLQWMYYSVLVNVLVDAVTTVAHRKSFVPAGVAMQCRAWPCHCEIVKRCVVAGGKV